jgi:hypothetical protein
MGGKHVIALTTLSGWWFGKVFIFPYTGKNHPK